MFDDWHDTAGVRGTNRRLFVEEQEQGLALFSAAEVPELSHPLVAERGASIRDFLLAQRLYQYLLFTVHLETRVVNRALERIGNGRLGISVRDEIRLDACKIYTDEAYHALSNLDLVRQVAAESGIPPGEYCFDPVLSALDGPAAALSDAPGLGQLLQAVVFETMVTSILDVLPRDPTVNTVVRTVVADHAADERRHHAYFSRFFPEIWHRLDTRLRSQTAGCLPAIVRACLEPDLRYARQTLRAAGFQPTEADQVLVETYQLDMVDTRIRKMSRHTVQLFRATGVLDVPGADDAFAAARLIAATPLQPFRSRTSAGENMAMTPPSQTTVVGDDIAVQGSQWSFSGSAAKHFDEHVSRSVPGYHDGHAMVAQLSDFFVRDGSRVIEVGCSTATLTALLAARHTSVSATFHGVDLVPEMVAQARRRCAELPAVNIELADAQRIDYADSTFVVMYYTLQFVAPDRRLELLRRIYTEIRPGGAVVLFEKTRCPDARLQDLFNQMYEEFKLSAGFTSEDILNKARSLRGVLEPLTGEQNLALLRTAGFTDSWLIHKHLTFEGLLGIKPVL